MTREEMINYGEMFLEANPASKSADRYEYVEKSLELLKQEPCEDCVSRAEVNQIIEDYCDEQYAVYSDRTKQRAFGAKKVGALINELPSVTPTRKKGKWINIDKTHSKCDRCESIFEIASANGESNYCPNCGAEMEHEQNLKYADQDTMMPAT